MAETRTHFDLKILVDKEKGRVLFAEVDGHFAGVLFSFLTLPLGTIVRLIGKSRSEPSSTLGCFSTLYQSVTTLGNEHFREKDFKDMLLHPPSSYGDIHQRLKINIDDTESKYYLCGYNTSDDDSSCGVCGRSMALVEKSKASGSGYNPKRKGFFNEALKFIITDDLQVTPVVPGSFVGLLKNFGTIDLGVIEERTVKVGLNELIELLKATLLSTTPLTDLFGSKTTKPVLEPVIIPSQETHSGEGRRIDVKVVLKKSSKEFVYVEAGGDFIDFLFSLLLIPLGGMLHILDGQSGLGCIDKLYKSAQSLDYKHFLSHHEKTILVRPKLPPHFICNNHLFPLEPSPIRCFTEGTVRTVRSSMRELGSGGFVGEEEMFIVFDDLTVKPSSSYQFSDLLEDRTLSIGIAEGISILRASLNSASAVSNSLLILNGHDSQPESIPDSQSFLSPVDALPPPPQQQVCPPDQKVAKRKGKRSVPEESPQIPQEIEYVYAKKNMLDAEYRNTLALKLWELEEKNVSSMSPMEFKVWQERRTYLKSKLDEANVKLRTAAEYHNSASESLASEFRKI